MSAITTILTNFKFINLNSFPENPKIGQLAFVNYKLYIYSDINAIELWYPLTNEKKSYIHFQGLESVLWTVTHNLGSEHFLFMVYDENDNLIFVNPSDITINSFKLEFAHPIKGKVIVFTEYEHEYNVNEIQAIFDQIVLMSGSGSNLDADKLDGEDGLYYLDWNNLINTPVTNDVWNINIEGSASSLSQIIENSKLPERLQEKCELITDWNDAIHTGFYKAAHDGTLNSPIGALSSDMMGLVQSPNSTHCVQTVCHYRSSVSENTRTYRRQMINGTWYPWYKLLSSEEELDNKYAKVEEIII